MSTVVNPYVFGVPLVELARDSSFFESISSQSAYSSDARNIGTASATRRVFGLIVGNSPPANDNIVVNSATIGGVAATIHVQITGGTNNNFLAAIVSAVVPTGATAVVNVFFNKDLNNFACGTIALDKLMSASPSDTATGVDSNPVSTGSNLDTSAGGYAMAVCLCIGTVNVPGSCSWNGLIETVDGNIERPLGGDTIFIPYAAAFSQNTPQVSGATAEATFSPGGPSTALAALSWR